jgi:hypothetical protein
MGTLIFILFFILIANLQHSADTITEATSNGWLTWHVGLKYTHSLNFCIPPINFFWLEAVGRIRALPPRIGRANLPVCLPGLRMNLMGVIQNGRGEEGGPAGPPYRGQCQDAPEAVKTDELRLQSAAENGISLGL